MLNIMCLYIPKKHEKGCVEIQQIQKYGDYWIIKANNKTNYIMQTESDTLYTDLRHKNLRQIINFCYTNCIKRKKN